MGGLKTLRIRNPKVQVGNQRVVAVVLIRRRPERPVIRATKEKNKRSTPSVLLKNPFVGKGVEKKKDKMEPSEILRKS